MYRFLCSIYRTHMTSIKNNQNNHYSNSQANNMRLEIVDIGWLKEHEEIKPDRVEEVIEKILESGVFNEPILIDEKTGVILDGHHRYNASMKLGFSKIPGIMIDYLNDENISIDVWPDCGTDSITKQDVLDMALSGKVFPPKTSKHTIHMEIEKIEVSITELK